MTVAVIQARMGSTRLPGKVLRPLGNGTTLSWVVRAAIASGAFERVVVATSASAGDDPVVRLARSLGIGAVVGPETDVLSRYLIALVDEAPETTVVRLTADCPLLDPAVIALCVRAFANSDLDYMSTTRPRTLPRGLDVEVTTVRALRSASKHATGHERVHVTPALYLDPARYRLAGITFAPDSSQFRVTLDTPEDAILIDRVIEALGDLPIPWRELCAFLTANPGLVALNSSVEQKGLSDG